MSSAGTLEAAAQDRKARLAQLRGLKRKASELQENTSSQPQSTKSDDSKSSVTATYLSGRNYDPETRGPRLGFEFSPDADKDTIEARAAALQLKQKEQAAKEEQEKDAPIDLFKLQPKKPNWDLKRDFKERISMLDFRTKNAIARLVRERLQSEREKLVIEGTVTADGDVAAISLEGGELLEAVRVREQQDEKERRREREEDAELT
ncbi:hypothetical protein, variant 2 [Verruconis gallopava]|uniref:Uncharacterized protein n=1 Tax=Verruconis gallopava TaxID=253628 RepID=A0A0D2B195_9PEZI|nr:uncharacterized protein PV09_03647 [Verruconis gallopava]XP_016214958.1 hypothetical protein, variant 1 [Verruconis gallopava]XP_016214959.1 hypothetical protein, variant 2 [Verruconis gallopava]KIW05088.1 hypothetical protein PV09_03647 [Verruconis gallopava]KIW05089.1 hypothetical protein, variant 1 [Verruconis gallopava]KIW05090.1 hypothetical protein, variant 2 [Verruconis gallopava]